MNNLLFIFAAICFGLAAFNVGGRINWTNAGFCLVSCVVAGVMELRVMPSDPGFRDVDFVADWIAKLKNAHLFHDLKDMPEIERLVFLKDLEDWFEEMTH
jgi:hypothetical protein